MTSRPVPSALSRRRFLVAGAAGAAAPFLLRVPAALAEPTAPNPRAFGFPAADMTSAVDRKITFPVEGTVTWSDTYGACRDGCARRHEGQDLLGKKMQRLVACVDGTVVALRHEAGGNSLYLEDADGWYYAYLHINNDTPGTDDGKNLMKYAFADGLQEGDTVTKGQFVAYMGDSGNAESGPAHCHFEIRRPTKDGVWHAQAVNPKTSLKNATAAKVTDPADPPADPATDPPAEEPATFVRAGTFAPFASAVALVTRQYQDVLERDPSSASLDFTATGLATGAHTPAWFMASILASTENQASAGAVYRLYQAYFGRDPDLGGFSHWLEVIRGRGSLADVSGAFAASREFRTAYGPLDDTAFVKTVYRNVLGRAADATGLAYWAGQLAKKRTTRGRVMLGFSESTENQAKLAGRTQVYLMNVQMLGVVPSAPAMAIREKQLELKTVTIESLVDLIRLSPDYAKRIG